MGKYITTTVLIGDGGTGKTSLIKRFVEDRFSDEYISTIGCKTSKKVMNFDEHELIMMIKDLPGQDTFSRLNQINFKGAKGAIVVYDSTRRFTFERIDHWIEELFNVTGEIPVTILANKYDILKSFEDAVGVEAAQNAPQDEFDSYLRENFPEVPEFYSKYPEFGIPTFEVVPHYSLIKYAQMGKNKFGKKFEHFHSSAFTGENVEEAFQGLGSRILENILKGD